MDGNDARTDAELIAAANAGDVAAFEAIYRRYRDWAVRLAWRFTGNEDDALDVLQETFAYLVRKIQAGQATRRLGLPLPGGFRLTSSMTTFLYPAVKNLSTVARRKSGRFHSDDDALAAFPAKDDPPAADSDLAAALASLPEGQREVLLMRFVDEMELSEIAEALAIPLGTVKSRLHNALDELRQNPRVKRYFRG